LTKRIENRPRQILIGTLHLQRLKLWLAKYKAVRALVKIYTADLMPVM